MQGWHYGKGLIYYRPIFQLIKLVFLRARAMPRENILIAIPVPLNKTSAKNIKRLKIAEYPLHQPIRLGCLEIYIALLKSQPVNVRILPQGYCVSMVGLTR